MKKRDRAKEKGKSYTGDSFQVGAARELLVLNG